MNKTCTQDRKWLAVHDPAKLEALRQRDRVKRARWLKTKPPGYNAASVKRVYDKDRAGYNARMRQWRKDNPELAHKNDKAGSDARQIRMKASPAFRTAIAWQAQLSGLFSGRGFNDPRLSVIKTFQARFGCSHEELIGHFKRLFAPGMTMNNYGMRERGWCIDHIKPQRSFDFTKPGQMEEAFHFTNLRPMWFRENCAANHGSEVSLTYLSATKT